MIHVKCLVIYRWTLNNSQGFRKTNIITTGFHRKRSRTTKVLNLKKKIKASTFSIIQLNKISSYVPVSLSGASPNFPGELIFSLKVTYIY